MAKQERSAQEIFEDHLRQGIEGTAEEDFARNYAKDVVLLTGRGTYYGKEGLKYLAELLQEELPKAKFDYTTKLVEEGVAFLEWSGESTDARVEDGADTFVIQDGRIRVQTIHYTVKSR
jgi:hypothetical protein